MIMPCMNSTSAGDLGGSVPFVDGGSVLLGLPGAPGCTTTGVAGSVCGARAGEEKRSVEALTVSSAPQSTVDPRAEWNLRLHQKGQTFHFGEWRSIFSVLTLKKEAAKRTVEKCGSCSEFKLRVLSGPSPSNQARHGDSKNCAAVQAGRSIDQKYGR